MSIRAYEEAVTVRYTTGKVLGWNASKDSTHVENGRLYYGTMHGVCSVSTEYITAVYVDGSRIF